MKCDYCGENVKMNGAGCDWRQGRCPHRPSALDNILSDPYKSRYLNLFNSIKKWFKRG